MKATDRQRLISETKSLLQDIIQSGELNHAAGIRSSSPGAGDKQPSSPSTSDKSNSKKP